MLSSGWCGDQANPHSTVTTHTQSESQRCRDAHAHAHGRAHALICIYPCEIGSCHRSKSLMLGWNLSPGWKINLRNLGITIFTLKLRHKLLLCILNMYEVGFMFMHTHEFGSREPGSLSVVSDARGIATMELQHQLQLLLLHALIFCSNK